MARVVPSIALALAAALACSNPSSGFTDAAATIDAPLSVDARLPPADAAPPTPDAAPSDNPHGITLTDVTDLLPARYHGGRAEPDPWGVGSGVALGDLDGDGDLDVVLARADEPASGQPGGPPALLRNDTGDFPGFAEDPAFATLLAGRVAHAAALGDYDGDGDLDVFLACSGADVLLENDGDGAFTDVTAAAGVAGPDGDVTVGAVWADLDRDGLLDLYVVAHTAIVPPIPDPLQANRLYLGDGAGGFDDVSASSGAAGDGSSQAALVSDLDGDGDLEIYVANDQYTVDGQPEPTAGLDADALYDLVALDAGGPTFTDRGASAGVTGPRSSMGAALADLDRDGHDDLYVSDWGRNHLQLWRPDEQAYDTDTADWGLGVRASAEGYLLVSWGLRFVDLDRDGWEEVFVVNGAVKEPDECSHHQQLDRFLRRPPGATTFVDVTAAVGLPDPPLCPPAPDTPLSGRGVVTGDLDGDGDDDVIVSGFVEPYRFYRNDTPQAGRHHVRVRLRGTVSAPDPIGAVLTVTLDDGRVLRRTLYAGGDTYSQSARVLEVGTGGAASITTAHIAWPSGIVQTLDVPLDETVTIVEPAWLSLSARAAAAADPAPVLTYAPVDAAGQPLGAAAAGREVVVTRSDGVAVTVTDHGDGSYTAPLPHPGAAGKTMLTVDVDGVRQRPLLTIRYQ